MDFSKVSNKSTYKLSRRHFLKFGILATIVGASPFRSFAAIRNYSPLEKSLSFYNIHTGESLNAVYWADGDYLPDVLNEINYIMRDYRSNEIKPIDTRLLDLLYDIHSNLGTRQSFHIVSGFRCPATNTFLYKYTSGVDKNSLHMYGKAVDIRLPGHELSSLYEVAAGQKGGGVGYYPESEFVHIDVGTVRYW